MSSTNRLDVVIFGATGFTGAATVYEAVKLLAGLRWGVAGRNEAKLREVLATVGKRVQQDLAASVEVLIADVGDETSLRRMAERAKVVINCCGPYRFYGEPVVRACIAAGAHQVDVSGEPQYIERMQLEHDAAARAARVYLVSACGFDSIPADMGTVYTEQQFAATGGEVNSIESYLRVWFRGGRPAGAAVHYGTWESAVYGLAHWAELRPLRQKLFAQRLPEQQPRLRNRAALHRSATMGGRWCVPFLGADKSVVMRSQRVRYEKEGKRPIQMRTYMALDSWLHVAALMLFGAVFAVLARCGWGRSVLLRHPKWFSGGLFSHEGPTEETQRNSLFSMTFRAEGWRVKSAGGAAHAEQPDRMVTTRVTGTNPGYGATCVALLLAATTLLRESDRVPGEGGVLAPGAAFAKTSLIERLGENGFTFEVVADGESAGGKKEE